MRYALAFCLLAGFTTSAAAQSDDASHRAAVQRLMEVTRVREFMEENAETMIDTQLRQAPQLAPHADMLREFNAEMMNWDVLEPEYARIYMDVYTEAELRDQIAFYETPAGQSIVAKTPALVARTTELMSRRMQEAMPRLMERMMEAMPPPGARRPSTSPPERP